MFNINLFTAAFVCFCFQSAHSFQVKSLLRQSRNSCSTARFIERSWIHVLNASENQKEPDQDREAILSASSDLGEFNPSKKIPIRREVVVGDPQQRVLKEKEISVNAILKELNTACI